MVITGSADRCWFVATLMVLFQAAAETDCCIDVQVSILQARPTRKRGRRNAFSAFADRTYCQVGHVVGSTLGTRQPVAYVSRTGLSCLDEVACQIVRRRELSVGLENRLNDLDSTFFLLCARYVHGICSGANFKVMTPIGSSSFLSWRRMTG